MMWSRRRGRIRPAATGSPPLAAAVLLFTVPLLAAPPADRYRPKLRPPASLEATLKQMTPGRDAFPLEKEAGELAEVLGELGTLWREHPARAVEATELLLDAGF